MFYHPKEDPSQYRGHCGPSHVAVYAPDRSSIVIQTFDRKTAIDAAWFRHEVVNGTELYGRLVLVGDGVTNALLGTQITDELPMHTGAGTRKIWNITENSNGWGPVADVGDVLMLVFDAFDNDSPPAGSGTGSGTGTLASPGALKNLVVSLRTREMLG